MTTVSSTAIESFRNELTGRVIAPDDAEYDAARTIFLGGFDRRPALIARPCDASDVARTIAVARERGLPLAVRSGGHSGAGYGVIDHSLVVDVRDLRSLDIDVEGRTAWAGSGLTAGEYSTAVGAHGLATGFGDTGSVGIGGITLAGGVGYLVRQHGLTIDSVLGAEIVTASGDVLQLDDTSNPDLFWAIRGGGGNFGVVTRFRYRLHPVAEIVGGMLLLPATPDVIVGLVEAADAAPEALSIIANIMPAPPMPFVPAAHHGHLAVMMLICYAGDAEAGARAIAPFRALAQPLVDMVGPKRYPELFPPDDPSYHPLAVARTLFMNKVDHSVATTILDFLERSDASLRVAQLRVLGGAMSRIAPEATAFAHRRQRILANVACFYTGPADRPAREAWTSDFAAAIHQGDDAAYVAFLAEEGDARVRAAYPGDTWTRLAAIKSRYDPTNLFRLNHNVSPAR